MKKVCIFAQFPIGVLEAAMAGRGGGHAATWLPQLARAWETQDQFEIHWCILDKVPKPKTSTAWNQWFHQLPSGSITGGLVTARLPQRLACRKIISQIQPDLIHCWGTETLNGSALYEFPGPSILSMQGVVTALARTGHLKGWRWKLFEAYEGGSIRRASLVTSESRWGLDRVNEIVPGKRTRQIEYGVFPSFYDVAWAPDRAEPRILFAGGLASLKGVDIQLQMLKQNPQRKWTMAFAGDGPLAQALRELNDPKVEILGTLKTPELQQEMAKAWALVLPSRADTSPNVVKEARVIGLPVVGSPHGGHAEYIDHGKDGFIVPSEDPNEWFNALNPLASDYDLCQSTGTARHEFFREYFRPEKTAEAFLELYREMLN
jgi:glycosyltransferase involved in cell wall biosynthesis